ncbi:MAG: DNA-directed RNA polymerase subunit alpha C-terminal domain-containing protein [Planctomycetota bacterium]|jgi:DNA-directed RNA polymerase subunit alpha
MAVTRIPIPEWAKTKKADDRIDLSLAETGLSVRTVNCLEEQGIFTVKDLLHSTPKRLLEIPNFGEKTLLVVYEALEKLGYRRRSRRPAQEAVRQPVSEEDPFALLRG